MSDEDPYTIELRLCDDGGMVSHNFPGDPEHGSYLDRLNYLRAQTGLRDEHLPVKDPFACTGNAHLAGHHVRCTSPAHAPRTVSVTPVYDFTQIRTPAGYLIDGKFYAPEDVIPVYGPNVTGGSVNIVNAVPPEPS